MPAGCPETSPRHKRTHLADSRHSLYLSVDTPTFSAAKTIVAAALCVGVSLPAGCSSSTDSLPPAAPSNPLDECPETPNCARISKPYSVAAETLYTASRKALDALQPSQMELRPDSMQAHAAVRVAWIFTDDVDIAVESNDGNSLLHVRSASRVGQNDLGVNGRRVKRLLTAIENALSSHPPAGD